jgi:hypothetical protein
MQATNREWSHAIPDDKLIGGLSLLTLASTLSVVVVNRQFSCVAQAIKR